MPRTDFRSPNPCRFYAVFGFDHDWVNKWFSSAKHPEHNLLMNQFILIDHGASDAFDHCEATLYSMASTINAKNDLLIIAGQLKMDDL